MLLRIAAAATVVIGIILVASTISIPQLSVFGPESMQVGEIEDFSVSSVNFEGGEETWSSDPCYGSGVDIGVSPSIAIRENSLSLEGKGDWRYTGGAVGYEFPITVKAVEPDDFVTIEFTVSCLDGSEEIRSKFVSVTEVVDEDDSGFTPQNPDIRQYKPPTVQVNGNTVKGTVYLENVGGDMVRHRIVEMQVRPKDQPVLSVVSRQETCDPTHPENVHKEYSLDAGERRSITLTVDDVPIDERTVYFITATQCGGEWTEPYTPLKYGNVCVGGGICPDNQFWQTVGLLLFGILAIFVGGVLLSIG